MKTHIRLDDFANRITNLIGNILTLLYVFWVINFVIYIDCPIFLTQLKQYQADLLNYLWTSRSFFTLASVLVFPVYVHVFQGIFPFFLIWIRKKLYPNASLTAYKKALIIRKYTANNNYGDNIQETLYYLTIKNHQNNKNIAVPIRFDYYQKIQVGQELTVFYRDDVKGLFCIEIS